MRTNASIDDKLDAIEKLDYLPNEKIFEEWAVKTLTRVYSPRLWRWFLNFLNTRKRKGKFFKAFHYLISSKFSEEMEQLSRRAMSCCSFSVDQIFQILRIEKVTVSGELLEILHELLSTANIKKIYDSVVENLGYLMNFYSSNEVQVRNVLRISLLAPEQISGICNYLTFPDSPIAPFQRSLIKYLEKCENIVKVQFLQEYCQVQQNEKERFSFVRFIVNSMDWGNTNGFLELVELLKKYCILTAGEYRQDEFNLLKGIASKIVKDCKFWHLTSHLIEIDGLLFENLNAELWAIIQSTPSVILPLLRYYARAGLIERLFKDFLSNEGSLTISDIGPNTVFYFNEIYRNLSDSVRNTVNVLLDEYPKSILNNWLREKQSSSKRILDKELCFHSKKLKRTSLDHGQSETILKCLLSSNGWKTIIKNHSVLELLSYLQVKWDLIRKNVEDKEEIVDILYEIAVHCNIGENEFDSFFLGLINLEQQLKFRHVKNRTTLRRTIIHLSRRLKQNFVVCVEKSWSEDYNVNFPINNEHDLSFALWLIKHSDPMKLISKLLGDNYKSLENVKILKLLCYRDHFSPIQQHIDSLLKFDRFLEEENHNFIKYLERDDFMSKVKIILLSEISLKRNFQLENTVLRLLLDPLERLNTNSQANNLFISASVFSRSGKIEQSIVKRFLIENRICFQSFKYKLDLRDELELEISKKPLDVEKFCFIFNYVLENSKILGARDYFDFMDKLIISIPFTDWSVIILFMKFFTCALSKVPNMSIHYYHIVIIAHLDMLSCMTERNLTSTLMFDKEFVVHLCRQILIILKSENGEYLVPSISLVLSKFLKTLKLKTIELDPDNADRIGSNLTRLVSSLCNNYLRDTTRTYITSIVRELIYLRSSSGSLPVSLKPYFINCIMEIFSILKKNDLERVAESFDDHGKELLQQYQQKYINEYAKTGF